MKVGETEYPDADQAGSRKGHGGNATKQKLLIHTTETSNWPDQADPYSTLSFNPWSPRGERWRQHAPVDGFATTVQIEIVGFCSTRKQDHRAHVSQIGEEAYEDLGKLLAFMHVQWGMPIRATPVWLPYPASYGRTRVRMDRSHYDAFLGLLGGQHTPGVNRGDPGNLTVSKILKAAQEVIAPAEDWVHGHAYQSQKVRGKTGKIKPVGE